MSQIVAYGYDKLQRILCRGGDIQESRDRLEKYGIYFNTNSLLRREYLNKYKNVFFLGICEAPECFEPIRTILQEELQPVEPLSDVAAKVLTEINGCNSICVNVRLGDYLSNRFRNAYFICDKGYYDNALSVMRAKFPDAHFFVFSDEITKARSFFADECDVTFVPQECSPVEEIRLMS